MIRLDFPRAMHVLRKGVNIAHLARESAKGCRGFRATCARATARGSGGIKEKEKEKRGALSTSSHPVARPVGALSLGPLRQISKIQLGPGIISMRQV